MNPAIDVDAEIVALEARLEKLKRLHELRREVAALEGKTNQPGHIEKLAVLVANKREIAVGVLYSRAKQQYIAESRFIVFYLARKFTSISSMELGRIFNRDHGTVLCGFKRCEELLVQDVRFAKQVREIESEFVATQN